MSFPCTMKMFRHFQVRFWMLPPNIERCVLFDTNDLPINLLNIVRYEREVYQTAKSAKRKFRLLRGVQFLQGYSNQWSEMKCCSYDYWSFNFRAALEFAITTNYTQHPFRCHAQLIASQVSFGWRVLTPYHIGYRCSTNQPVHHLKIKLFGKIIFAPSQGP